MIQTCDWKSKNGAVYYRKRGIAEGGTREGGRGKGERRRRRRVKSRTGLNVEVEKKRKKWIS